MAQEEAVPVANGNYYYIDTIREAEKVLVNQLGATLFTIAKNVKIQVEFNPAQVSSYRLLGYESRLMDHQEFDNDRKNAGDIGAGFVVTALYEIVPLKSASNTNVNLRYPAAVEPRSGEKVSDELLNVKMRFKFPNEFSSQLREFPFKGPVVSESVSKDINFAAAVAEFGLLLRNSENMGRANLRDVLSRAESSMGHDDGGYRKEFVRLVQRTMNLQGENRIDSSGR